MGWTSTNENKNRMIMKRMNTLLLLMLISTFTGWSQSFPGDRAKFVKEFERQLTEYGKGEFRDFAKAELPALLLEGTSFSDEYFTRMVQTCNAFEAKKLKVYPEIYNYVYSVAQFVKTKFSRVAQCGGQTVSLQKSQEN
jgi:hypothetical protein